MWQWLRAEADETPEWWRGTGPINSNQATVKLSLSQPDPKPSSAIVPRSDVKKRINLSFHFFGGWTG